MMDNLRTASNHVVLKIILGLIIFSFVLSGVGNYLIGGSHDYAAKVNGEVISRAQFENAFNNERASQQQQLGENYAKLASNEQFIQQMRQQVLSQLIDQTVLQQYVQSLHLSVNDEQIKQSIFAVPQFQTDGHFDNARYNQVLSSVGYTPDRYADSLRKSLANQQLAQAIGNTDFVLKNELEQLVGLSTQQRQIRQAVIDVHALAAKQTATADEISAYYHAHQAVFKTPEQFKISYIKLDAKALQKAPTEQQIQAWYDQHKADYGQQARQRFSVIQVKTAEEAAALVKQLGQDGNFADLARQHSLDPISAKQGGDLGWMEMDSIPDELKSAHLTEKGQISGVVKSTVGYLVLRLDDLQPEQIQPLSAVHQAVAQKVMQETAITQFFALQQKVNDAASDDNDSLNAAEQVAGVKAVETDWFDQPNVPAEVDFDPIKHVLANGSLLTDNGAPGNNSSIIPVEGDRAFVVRIIGHKPAAMKPQSEVTTEITAKIAQQKAIAAASAQADKLVADLRQGKQENFTAAGLAFGGVQTLDRNQPKAITDAAFALPQPQSGKPSYGRAEDEQGNIVILALDKVKNGELPEAQQTQIATGIANNNAQLAFSALVQQLRQQAKISLGDATQSQ